ncbi:2-C-methyl-D-erythritol 4-phosphate cytidylyltransferase [Anaplasma capra]|nr:2-C-methyl-D-erythritol 4-phosphate cytidylyltransferase [Anaplasma capra]
MVIVAAGKGSRLGTTGLPKQYVKIHEQEVMWHAIVSSFAPYIHRVRVVIGSGHDALYQNAIKSVPVTIADRLLPPVHGGNRRQDSVRIGLDSLEHINPDLVAIHDACRPFAQAIPENTITSALALHSGVVPVLSPVETIHTVAHGCIAGSVDRESARIVQTPQVYKYPDLRACHRRVHNANPEKYFTDDSAIMLECGMSVATTEGQFNNFKITTSEDLLRAKLHLSGDIALHGVTK